VKRHAHSLFWFLYWALAGFAAVLVVLLISLKFLVEEVDQYRLDIQNTLATQLSAQVHIAGIQGSWRGWQPVIQLKGVAVDEIESKAGVSVGLLQGEIALDPLATLKAWAPIFSQFDLKGLTLKYDQRLAPESTQPSAEKQQTVTEQAIADSHAATTNAGSELLAFILSQRKISIEDTRIVLQQSNGAHLSVEPIQIHLQHDGVLHQLKIDADLVSGSALAKLKFVAEAEGDTSKNPASFYLKIAGLDHQLLNPWLQLADIELDSFEAEQEIWGEAHRGKLTYMTGKTSIANFAYQNYALEQFALHTALLRRDKSYQLQITDLNIAAAEQEFNLPRISLDLVRQGGKIAPLKLMVDRVELERLSNWLVKQPSLPAEIADVVKIMSPQGVIENLLVKWPQGGELTDFELLADLNRVGINAWDDVPELKGIDGLLTANIQGGAIHLQSSDFLMHYPTLFDYRWQYQHADGVIGWRFEDKGVVVASQLLHLKNEGVSAAGRFSIYLPVSDDEQPLLNLQIGMQASDGLHAKYYIPPEEVGQETYDWLVAAIKGGHIKQAGFVLNGVTRSRLDSYQLPSVQMFFDLEEATFDYQPGWPAITKADSFVFFRDGELIAQASGGKVYQSDVDYAWVHLPEANDKLFVVGSVDGKIQDLDKLFSDSPLKEEIGDELAAWDMSGDIQTGLNLNLPLEGKRQPQVKVQALISDGRLHSPKEGIDFTGINGLLKYNSASGLSAQKLTAKLFEQAVTASIDTVKKKTSVRINGAVASTYLRKWLDLDLLKVAKGKLSYLARLDMCPGSSCNQLVISSDLKGVELAAPAPLAKTAKQTSKLTVISDLGRQFKDDRAVVRLNLANQLRAVLVNKGKQVERARFTLGGARPVLPPSSGIWIDGKVASLDYDQLEQFFQEAGFTDSDASTAKSGASSQELLKQVELTIGQFSFEDIVLEKLKVKFTPERDGWLLAANSPQVGGTFWMPGNEAQPYKVKLRHLYIPKSEDDVEEVRAALEPDVEPGMLPKLDFSVQDLRYNDLPMGRWTLALRPTSTGATVKDIVGNMHGAEVKGALRWDKNGKELSDLTVKLDSADFGKVLDAWGASDTIETKQLNAYLQLSWPGAPWKFKLGETDGEMQFTAKQGRLLDVGNSGNILRVFGILNLQSLGRRLRLDFSDLVKTGVAFDEMKADYAIKKGIAHTSSPFMMTGPSANMAMSGSLNLMNETVDKEIEVALPVTDNIPLVSVLLGAPQVAGAVFLFDKLVGDPLAKFSTVKYRMTGDWGNPDIEIYKGKSTQ